MQWLNKIEVNFSFTEQSEFQDSRGLSMLSFRDPGSFILAFPPSPGLAFVYLIQTGLRGHWCSGSQEELKSVGEAYSFLRPPSISCPPSPLLIFHYQQLSDMTILTAKEIGKYLYEQAYDQQFNYYRRSKEWILG